jgi:hypothetical protein
MGRRSSAGWPELMTSGDARTASGKKLAEGRLKASGSTVLLGEVLRSWWRGQHGLRGTGGKQLLEGGAHRLRWFGAKSGERKGGGREQGLGVDPVLGAELLQWPHPAGMQWKTSPRWSRSSVRRSGSWRWHYGSRAGASMG